MLLSCREETHNGRKPEIWTVVNLKSGQERNIKLHNVARFNPHMTDAHVGDNFRMTVTECFMVLQHDIGTCALYTILRK